MTSYSDLIFAKQKEGDWLNPIAMRSLQEAVRGKRKTAWLNGVEYRITYGVTFTYPVVHDKVELIRLQRVDGGFVPYGCIKLSKILNFQFEGVHD